MKARKARIRLQRKRDRDALSRAGAHPGGERGRPVFEREADDAGVDIAPRLLVARRRPQEVLDDPILERGCLRAARRKSSLCFRERPVRPGVAAGGVCHPIMGESGLRRIAFLARVVREPQQQKEVRRRFRERALDVSHRPSAPRRALLGQEPCGVPARDEVPGPGRRGLLEGFGRPLRVARELAPGPLEVEDAGVARRQIQGLREQLLRGSEVFAAHRRDGSVGPAERLAGREPSHRLETLPRFREIVLLEGSQPHVLGGLERRVVRRGWGDSCENGDKNRAYGKRQVHPDGIILLP